MIKSIKFENGIQKIEINQDTGFKKLILVSATINKIENLNILPVSTPYFRQLYLEHNHF